MTALTFADLLGTSPVDEPVPEIGDLAPLVPAFKRAKRKQAVPDLTGLAKCWELIGEGNGGKSFLGRHLAGEMLANGTIDKAVLAAVAPGNRSLTGFFSVMQPEGTEPKSVAGWIRKAQEAMARRGMSGIFDYGGGDTSKAYLAETSPGMVDALEEQGLAVVAAYVLTPRLEDMVYLKGLEQRGYRPRATALILNLAKATDPSVFDPVRRHPVYRAALDRGAVELWMPALEPQSLALTIERNRLHFRQARDGDVPEGRPQPDISAIERAMVREWMDRMAAEFASVEEKGWMPWT